MVVSDARSDALPKQLEPDGDEQEHELPVYPDRPDHLPDAAMDLREDERRELPEHVLRTEFAQAAAGEAAADREERRAPFADEERRDADHRADDQARAPAVEPSREA